MDIMNELPEEQFEKVDDLLAFISIYDDENRTKEYFKLLDDSRHLIRGQVCVEAGCGFGLMAERMAALGAKKVYAVEANEHLFDIAKQRLRTNKNIEVVHADIRDFEPQEEVNVLVHEFFGQLLFDEDIHVLDQLQFVPRHILPNQASLQMTVLNSTDFTDEVVSSHVLQKLSGVLVSGLFDAEDVAPNISVMRWPSQDTEKTVVDLSGRQGDLLCFGLEINHENKFVCRAGVCDNWSLVWTPRAGNRFEMEFIPRDRGADIHFNWID